MIHTEIARRPHPRFGRKVLVPALERGAARVLGYLQEAAESDPHRHVSTAEIMRKFFSYRQDPKIVHVYITLIRKYLAAHEPASEVETLLGAGYRLVKR